MIEKTQYNYFTKDMFNKYDAIVIDPPWNQGKTGKRKVRPRQTTTLDYPTITKEELLNMPVGELGKNDSFIFLWTTNSKGKKTKGDHISSEGKQNNIDVEPSPIAKDDWDLCIKSYQKRADFLDLS